MSTNGTNGAAPAAAATAHGFDPEFTQHVIDTMGPKTTARNRQVLSALVRHLHDFARDVELTYDEWLAGVKFVNDVGRAWTPTRNEGLRVSDVLGLESLLVEIEHAVAARASGGTATVDPTSASILGPFWSPDAPFRAHGATIAQDGVPPNGRSVLMHGVIRAADTGLPLPGAVLDIWQASANGKYDFQDPDNQTPNNLRGKFRAGADGTYALQCLHPTAYSLPTDGPAYQLLQLMDRHPMRPAHIHIMVTHPDYIGCTTQLYPRDDPWLSSDTVFAVKTDLVVDFPPLPKDSPAIAAAGVAAAPPQLELVYNVTLVPKAKK